MRNVQKYVTNYYKKSEKSSRNLFFKLTMTNECSQNFYLKVFFLIFKRLKNGENYFSTSLLSPPNLKSLFAIISCNENLSTHKFNRKYHKHAFPTLKFMQQNGDNAAAAAV